jgi:chitin synthase
MYLGNLQTGTYTENYTWNKYDPDSGGYKLVQEPLKIEPIGFTIILFLSLILIIQTIGMLLHRWHTLSHVLASTELVAFRQRRGGNSHGDDMLEENAVQIGV